MGLKMTDNIVLTDNLNGTDIESYNVPVTNDFNYNQRIEYSLLQTQKELAMLDIRNTKMGYLPQLAAFGTFGYNPAASKLSNIVQRALVRL